MIRNSNCAYCGVLLNKSENGDNCASVEHMFPNSAFRKKRNNAEGDFLVCRKCNLKKSRMDEVVGLTTRLSNNSDDELISKYLERVDKNDKLFKKALESLSNYNGSLGLNIPFSVREAIEYFEHYGKGQHLICTGKIFNEKTHTILIDIMGQSVVKELQRRYQESTGADPFEDLLLNKNKGVLNIQGDSFIVHSDDASDMVLFFNKVLLVKINIRESSRIIQTIKNKLRRNLHNSWNK